MGMSERLADPSVNVSRERVPGLFRVESREAAEHVREDAIGIQHLALHRGVDNVLDIVGSCRMNARYQWPE